MSEIDPGVYTTEEDLSQYTPTTVDTIVGIVGVFNKGVLDIITRVTSEDDLVSKFGTPINSDSLCQAFFAAASVLKRGNKVDIVRVDAASTNAAANAMMSLPGTTSQVIADTTHANDGTTANPGKTLTSVSIDFAVAGVLIGDVVEITTADADVGFYKITNVAAKVLTVSVVWPGPGAGRGFTVHSQKREAGVNGATGVSTTRSFTSVGATFTENGVVAGDILVIADSTPSTVGDNGVYRISTVSNETTLLLDRDFPVGGLGSLEYSVYGKLSSGATGDTQVAGEFLFAAGKFQSHNVQAGDILVIDDAVTTTCNGAYYITGLKVASEETILTVNNIAWDASVAGTLSFYVLPGSVALTPVTKGTWCEGYKLYPLVNAASGIKFDVSLFTPTGISAIEKIFNCNAATAITQFAAQSELFTAADLANRNEPCPGFGLIASANSTIYLAMSGGNDGTTSILSADYITGIQLWKNKEQHEVDIILCPSITAEVVQNELYQLCEVTREDCCYIVDGPRTSIDTMQEVLDYVNGVSVTKMDTNTAGSSYGAFYTSWQQVYDKWNGVNRWVAPSGLVAAVWVYNDSKKFPWFAPAGFRRGKIIDSLACDYSPSHTDRKSLYSDGQSINSIVEFEGDGIYVWGNKTLYRGSTALNRISVRRMLNFVKKAITLTNRNLPFEPNDEVLWREFISRSEPLLAYVLKNRGIREYRIIADGTTTTDAMIAEYRMKGKVLIKPQLPAEIIELGFTLTSQTADFTELK